MKIIYLKGVDMAETKSKSKAKPKSSSKPKAVVKPKTITKSKAGVKPKIEMKLKSAAPVSGVTFKCRLCEKQKPISEMKIIKRYRPVIFVCSECEKTIQ
jgi:hypothetical protein